MRVLRKSVLALGVLSLCLAAATGWADDNDAERRKVYEAYLDFSSLVEGGAVTPGWLPDGSSFWYAEGTPQDTVILKVDPIANTSEPLFSTNRLRTVLTDALGHEPVGRGVPFQSLYFTSPTTVSFSVEGTGFLLDLESYELEKMPPAPFEWATRYVVPTAERTTGRTFPQEDFRTLGVQETPEAPSPDGKYFASIKAHNVVLRATIDGREVGLTTDGAPEYPWNLDNARWQPWSPDGKRLVARRVDPSGMGQDVLVKYLKDETDVEYVPTVQAGGTMPVIEFYVIDLRTKQAVKINLGDTTDQYLTMLGWLPDGAEVLLCRVNREFNSLEILAADPVTGETRSVMTERRDTFIKIHHEVFFYGQEGFTLLPDGSGFILESERDGWNHLYLYDIEGNLERQLTKGAFPVLDVVEVDQAGGWVYLTAHGDAERPYDTHFYRVGLDDGGFARLTEGKGQHTTTLSPSKQFLLDTYSSVDVPPRTELRTASGKLLRTLAEADISRLEALGWTPAREFTVKAADGETDLWGTMYFPYDFDPQKSYPVVEYIYGGPQMTLAIRDFNLSTWSFDTFPRALANLGYITVMVDARGTPGRSKAFHDVVFGNWGRYEIPDHAAAIRQLAERHTFIDLNRVGIYGHSWGGYFTFRAMTQAPDVYKVGIAAAPGYDPYRSQLREPYIGLPQKNPEAWEYASTFKDAAKIRGAFMQVGGTSDFFTYRDLIAMSDALIKANVHHDVMLLPNQGHAYFGQSNAYWLEGMVRYFAEHLQGQCPGAQAEGDEG
ncbi:MAG: S9 family peptidase [Acidobacteria bacterium]|nr:MAG: S9 family peptidase [Acidobacteriota bacterium]